jgi:hypothetical protein
MGKRIKKKRAEITNPIKKVDTFFISKDTFCILRDTLLTGPFQTLSTIT